MYIIKLKTKHTEGYLRSFPSDPQWTDLRVKALRFAKKATAEKKAKMLNERFNSIVFSVQDDDVLTKQSEENVK